MSSLSYPTVLYTKDSLVDTLKDIRARGWIQGTRQGNAGNVGNTLEDLLGIKENNLPIPNAAEWEIKCQRLHTKSLTTLFHLEPSPTALKFVSTVFLPFYGWPHKAAGQTYSLEEKSFRQTLSTQGSSDRGFRVVVDRIHRKVLISFDASSVSEKHKDWLMNVEKNIGLGDIDPQPYWGFDDLFHKAGTKMHHCFFVGALCRRVKGIEYFHYLTIRILKKFDMERFIHAIERGEIFVDFDARTGHNHGTKFRFRNSKLHELYDDVTEI